MLFYRQKMYFQMYFPAHFRAERSDERILSLSKGEERSRSVLLYQNNALTDTRVFTSSTGYAQYHHLSQCTLYPRA
jgi:hypothetical protein